MRWWCNNLDVVRERLVDALFVVMPKSAHTLLLRALQDAGHRVDALVEVLERRAEGQADEVMAGGAEEVAAMRGIDVEEDAGNNDALLLEQLLEERLASEDGEYITLRRYYGEMNSPGRCSEERADARGSTTRRTSSPGEW